MDGISWGTSPLHASSGPVHRACGLGQCSTSHTALQVRVPNGWIQVRGLSCIPAAKRQGSDLPRSGS